MGAKKPKQKSLGFVKDATTLFDAKHIPQADSLPRVRAIVAAVDAKVKTPEEFAAATGFSDRHVAYNRRAAVILELITEEPAGFALTKFGSKLLVTEAESAEERACFNEAILTCKLLAPFRTFFESDEEWSPQELGYRIGQMTGLAQSTAERRAQCLIAWKRYIRPEPAAALASGNHVELAEQIKAQVAEQNAKALDDFLTYLQTKITPEAFEKLVARLLLKMGYKDVKRVGGPGDGGVDVRAVREDAFGQHDVAVQAKRYRKTVGRRFVHELIGVMHGENCDEAILFTTGVFAKDAIEAQKTKPTLRLIDGRTLVAHLVNHEIHYRKNEHGVIVLVPTDAKAKPTTLKGSKS